MRDSVAAQITRLFEDGGAPLLRDLGQPTWGDVLDRVPAQLYADDPDGITALSRIREFWSKTKNLRQAIVVTRGLLGVRVARDGREHPDTLLEIGALGALALRGGKTDEAGALLQEAFAKLRSQGGLDLRLAIVAGNLGLWHIRIGDLDGAERVLMQAYRVRSRVAPESTGVLAAQLGELRVRQGRLDAAVEMLREAWLKHLDTHGPEHPLTMARARTLGNVLNKLELYREAAPVLRDVHTWLSRSSKDDEAVAAVAYDLGVALTHSYKKEEGLRRIEESLRWTRAAEGPGGPHPALATRLAGYSQIVLSRGRPAEAEGLLLEALEADRRSFGDDSAEVAGRYAALGYFCAQSRRVSEAVGWLDAAASLLRSTLGDHDPRTEKVVEYQVGLLLGQAQNARDAGDHRLAEELIRRARTLAEPVLGHGHRALAEIRKLESFDPRARRG